MRSVEGLTLFDNDIPAVCIRLKDGQTVELQVYEDGLVELDREDIQQMIATFYTLLARLADAA